MTSVIVPAPPLPPDTDAVTLVPAHIGPDAGELVTVPADGCALTVNAVAVLIPDVLQPDVLAVRYVLNCKLVVAAVTAPEYVVQAPPLLLYSITSVIVPAPPLPPDTDAVTLVPAHIGPDAGELVTVPADGCALTVNAVAVLNP